MNTPPKQSQEELLKEVQDMYTDVTGDSTFGALISAVQGMGKTTMIGTAPYPILVYMFDPKGYIVLKKQIDEGKVLVVPLWGEQSQNPTKWKQFIQLSDKHMDTGFINKFATVAVDSLTYALEALTNFTATEMQVATNKTRLKNLPHLGDYRVIYQHIMDRINRFSEHPVNLIFTSHLEMVMDETTKEIKAEILAYSKLRGLLPPMFTEKYYILADKPDATGIAKRYVITQPRNRYMASTQFELPARVEPNICKIMKDAGFTVKHKELLK